MDIITRQVLGGFIARFSDQTKFAQHGVTRDAAIVNLFLEARKKLGIKRLLWDRKDKWTRNYLAGKSNRRKPGSWVKELPKVAGLDEARRLIVKDLPIPIRVRKAIRYAVKNEATLGMVCEVTLTQIRTATSGRYKFGAKTELSLHQLLMHYGLSLRQEE